MKRLKNSILVIGFLFLIAGCTSFENKENQSPVTKDRIAVLVWNDMRFEIVGSKTPKEKINEEIGHIKNIVTEAFKNGDASLFRNDLTITKGTKIYSLKQVDEKTVIAIKIENVYYSAYAIAIN